MALSQLDGTKAHAWMKLYRTEIAASSSSVLSTCIAVRRPSHWVPPANALETWHAR